MFEPSYTPTDECGCGPDEATAISSLACEECAQECDSAACTVELTSQCTDQCVVVACNDAQDRKAHV